jgi:2,4-dienoyl-CoA reductase-like NADH-dependent reductase (Old Yellow Enzyme family)/thioredoxin reductase
MDFPYKKLLEPYTLQNGLTLKNHITFPNALHTLSQGPENHPAEIQIAEVTEVCSSGASLVSYRHYSRFGGGSFGNRALSDTVDKAHFPLCDYTNPAVQNYVCQIAAQAHMNGSKILVKMEQTFPDGMTYGGGDARSLFPLPADSKIKLPPHGKTLTMEEMKARICPKEKFPEIIAEMVTLLKKYQSWGFDGMSFRCDRYIDQDTNLREDEYGGEIENRARFTYELFSAIRKELGSKFIIEGILPSPQTHGHDGELPHGYDWSEVIRFAKMFDGLIDILQIRIETMAGYHPTGDNSRPHEHPQLAMCRAIKEAGVCKTTISANAGFIDPDDMEAAIESGDCDLISAGRAFLAEPEYVRKLYSYQTERPIPCVQCNKCHGTNGGPWLAFCTVNPRSGLWHRMPYIEKKSLHKKKVAVIGGGPIGMRAACLAAQQGHQVTLFEKTDWLGGKLRFAEIYELKWPFKRYRDWLVDELSRRQVTVQLNTAPPPEDIRAAGFDAVIAATGSVAQRPPVDGADSPGVWSSEDVYEGRAELGQTVVVVGGAEVGTETAIHLARQGKDVTVISRSDMLMPEEWRPHGPHWAYAVLEKGLDYGGTVPSWYIYDNLTEVCSASTTHITPTSVTYVKDGQERTIHCDSVVVNGGYRKCKENALSYASAVPEFYLVGDVKDDCSNIQQGNVSAMGVAYLL